MTPSSPFTTASSTSPSTPPNRPSHRIQRKPFDSSFSSLLSLETFAFPPPSQSSLQHQPFLLGSESPRLLSSPEPQSSPCTSDFDDSEETSEENSEDEIGAEEDNFRRGMPRLQASLKGFGTGLEDGGWRINFARPLGSQGSVRREVELLDSEEEEEEGEEGPKRIVDPEAVQHLFGRSIQRTRRINTVELTKANEPSNASIFTSDSLILDSPLTSLALTPLPASLSNPASKRFTPTPSIRSEQSSASLTSSVASRRLASTKAAYIDEFAEMASEETEGGLGLYKDEKEEKEHEEKRRGIDFGGAGAVDEMGMLESGRKGREELEELVGSVLVFDDEEVEDVEGPFVAERGRKAVRRNFSSPFASSRPSTPIGSTTSIRPSSLESPYDFSLTAHTPASALALFATIPTSEPVAPLPLPSLSSASLQPSVSLSSSLRSVSSSFATSFNSSLDENPRTTIPSGAYTTRQNRRPNPAPIGLRELRELRTAALVLEMDAKKYVRVPSSMLSHPREMEKKVKRKPVPVVASGVEKEEDAVVVVTRSESSRSGSPTSEIMLTEKEGGGGARDDFFVSLPSQESTMRLRPPRSSARPLSIAIMPSSPPPFRHTLSSSDVIAIFRDPFPATESTLLPSAPPALVRRSTTTIPRRGSGSTSTASLPLPSRAAPLPSSHYQQRHRSTLSASTATTSTSGPSSTFKLLHLPSSTSSSLHYSRHSLLTQRRRSSGASSASSFESCPIPPTPLEASFFPACPTPTLDEIPRTNSLLFELLNAGAGEATLGSSGSGISEWNAGVEVLADEAEVGAAGRPTRTTSRSRMSKAGGARRETSPASTTSSFSSSHATAKGGAGVGLGLGLKAGLGWKGLKWGANGGASLGGRRVWSGTKALNGSAGTEQ